MKKSGTENSLRHQTAWDTKQSEMPNSPGQQIIEDTKHSGTQTSSGHKTAWYSKQSGIHQNMTHKTVCDAKHSETQTVNVLSRSLETRAQVSAIVPLNH